MLSILFMAKFGFKLMFFPALFLIGHFMTWVAEIISAIQKIPLIIRMWRVSKTTDPTRIANWYTDWSSAVSTLVLPLTWIPFYSGLFLLVLYYFSNK